MGRKVIPAPDTSQWRIGRRNPSHLTQHHAVGRARGDTEYSGGHYCLPAGTTRIIRHVTTSEENYAHSRKNDCSTGVSERQVINARGAGKARADRS
jgi:hypothetical protein